MMRQKMSKKIVFVTIHVVFCCFLIRCSLYQIGNCYDPYETKLKQLNDSKHSWTVDDFDGVDFPKLDNLIAKLSLRF